MPTRYNMYEEYYNNDVCVFETCGGQALHETKTVQSVSAGAQSWGGSYSNFLDSTYPWLRRGGASNNAGISGLFYTFYNYGGAGTSVGFRPSLSAF